VTVVSRGEAWHANLNPSKGKEIHGTRPCLVVSVDPFNHGPADLVVVLPITTTNTGIPFHIRIDPPESGATKTAYIKTEQPRCISMNRLERYRGNVHPSTMSKVEDCLRILLGL
jgi:mRNA interferase MazF